MYYRLKPSINLGNASVPNDLSSAHMGPEKRTPMVAYFWLESSPSKAHNY